MTGMAVARLASTSLDCADPAPLADFSAALLGGEGACRSDEFCAVQTGNGWIAAVKVADYRPPTWPAAEVPKQIHLDLATSDLEAVESEALRPVLDEFSAVGLGRGAAAVPGSTKRGWVCSAAAK